MTELERKVLDAIREARKSLGKAKPKVTKLVDQILKSTDKDEEEE